MFKKLFIIFTLSFCQITWSQSNVGAWYMSFSNISIGERFVFQNDVQYRNFNLIGDLEQLLLRGGVGMDLTENNNNVLVGYAFVRSGEIGLENESLEERVNEHRIYQQFITNQKFGRFHFSHRYRMEERFIKHDIKYRFRYFLNVRMALNNKELVENTFYLSAYNELFVNFGNEVYDRDRVYGAIGYIFNENLRMDIGAMTQIYQEAHRPQFQLGLFKTF